MRHMFSGTLLAVMAVLALSSPTHAQAGTRDVVIKNIAFSPANITINRGSTVRWLWRDGSIRHNVHSVGTRRFTSSATRSTGSYRFTFRRSGLYRYVCTIHPGQTGSVRVR